MIVAEMHEICQHSVLIMFVSVEHSMLATEECAFDINRFTGGGV